MLKKIKRVLIMICLVICCGIAGGCSGSDSEEEFEHIEDEGIQIGFSFDSFVLERWIRERDVFVSAAANMGATVNVQNANGDLATQREQIQYFIKKKVDVIVIVAADSNGLSDVVAEARKADIKVIAYDRMINNADINLYISFDNEKVGELMAKSLIGSTQGNGNYLMLCGPTTDDNVERVVNGFNKAIEGTNINIKGTINAENWRAEAAYEYLENNNDIISEIDGIMCGNDNIATQTVRFLAENAMAGKIPVVGQDADLEACQRIVEGTQLMTVYKPVESLAQTAAEAAVLLAEGKSLDEMSDDYIEKDGSITKLKTKDGRDVDYVRLEPVAVNTENMDSVIIGGGFHLEEEVYINIKNK